MSRCPQHANFRCVLVSWLTLRKPLGSELFSCHFCPSSHSGIFIKGGRLLALPCFWPDRSKMCRRLCAVWLLHKWLRAVLVPRSSRSGAPGVARLLQRPQLKAAKVKPILTTLRSFCIALDEHVHKSPASVFTIKGHSTGDSYSLTFH